MNKPIFSRSPPHALCFHDLQLLWFLLYKPSLPYSVPLLTWSAYLKILSTFFYLVKFYSFFKTRLGASFQKVFSESSRFSQVALSVLPWDPDISVFQHVPLSTYSISAVEGFFPVTFYLNLIFLGGIKPLLCIEMSLGVAIFLGIGSANI